jgi:tryptophanyl-tRNA synthetase
MSAKKRVLSGIRATGKLHLGNYLGAVKGMLALQADPSYETFFMVADLHTMTTPYKVEDLRTNRRELYVEYLACGLDPQKDAIFFQSDVPEHTELAFYLSTVMTIAKTQHLPTYKEKVKQYPHNNTLALLNYPMLMAADILVYKAGFVPVGLDQEPHLEVAREVARRMNDLYGLDFPEPVRFKTEGEYIPSLKGEGKMGKSIEGSFINLTDTEDEVRKKVRSIPTATEAGGEMNGGVKALFAFADMYIPQSVEKYKKEFESGSLQFSTIKDEIASAISTSLKPIQQKREELMNDTDYVEKTMREGAEKARAVASHTLKEVRMHMGLS